MEQDKTSGIHDALASVDFIAKRRAGQSTPQPPAVSPGVPCPYHKGTVCDRACNGRGFCLDVA